MPSPTLTGYEHKVIVGIADLAVTNNQNVTLTTYSLGSCLGIAVYDGAAKVGGLLHVMLPDSAINPEKATAQPGMFVDTGVPALLRATCNLHADRSRLTVYVAGGAQILDGSGYFNIGKRNLEAVQGALSAWGLRIHAQDVGGMVNRTMSLRIATGELSLKISGQPTERRLCRNSTIT